MKRNWQVLFHDDSRTPAREISRQSALDRFRRAESIWIGKDGKDIVAYMRTHALTVMGDRVFWRNESTLSFRYIKGKIYGNIGPFRDFLMMVLRLNWISGSPWAKRLIGINKDLWKAVLSGRITNPEMLAKYYSKKYFKGAYSYRTLKRCFSRYGTMSLWDVYYYTTNPDLAVNKLLDYEEDYSLGTPLLQDVLRMAKYFNEKVNPSWSAKRLTAEHQRQIERKNLAEIEAHSNEPIHEEFVRNGISLILNERECFLNASVMHNCTHSCYWEKVAQGRYILAKGTFEGKLFNFGIRVASNGRELSYDQIHYAYNQNVSEEVQKMCMDWLTDNYTDLLDVTRSIRISRAVHNTPNLENVDALAYLRMRMEAAENGEDIPF